MADGEQVEMWVQVAATRKRRTPRGVVQTDLTYEVSGPEEDVQHELAERGIRLDRPGLAVTRPCHSRISTEGRLMAAAHAYEIRAGRGSVVDLSYARTLKRADVCWFEAIASRRYDWVTPPKLVGVCECVGACKGLHPLQSVYVYDGEDEDFAAVCHSCAENYGCMHCGSKRGPWDHSHEQGPICEGKCRPVAKVDRGLLVTEDVDVPA